MAIDQNPQHIGDKQHKFFGSDRLFYTGANVTSGASYTIYLDLSGTNTRFGEAQNTHGNRFIIVGSGGNTAIVNWSFDSGTTLHGELLPGANAITIDGLSVNRISLGTNTSTQRVYIWVL